jgi:undecaprenyl-diphosphatase
VIFLGVYFNSFLVNFDQWFNSVFTSNGNLFFDRFFYVFTVLFETIFAAIFTAVLFCFLFFTNRRKDSWIMAITLGGAAILGEAIKFTVQRARPLAQHFITETNYSFPSMHALFSTAFMLSIIFLFKDKITQGIWRKIFIIVSIAVIVFVCLSRLYFGVHWFSDIIAGIVLGAGWFSFTHYVFRER